MNRICHLGPAWPRIARDRPLETVQGGVPPYGVKETLVVNGVLLKTNIRYLETMHVVVDIVDVERHKLWIISVLSINVKDEHVFREGTVSRGGTDVHRRRTGRDLRLTQQVLESDTFKFSARRGAMQS